MKVVTLMAEMAKLKVKLSCSQEQFANLLDKYFTQHLVEPADQDAVPDFVMTLVRTKLGHLCNGLRAYPRITQGQWLRIMMTSVEDAQEGCPYHPQPATFDATLSEFQEMEKVLNAQPDHEVMEVAEDSQVLGSQPMRSDDEAASDPPSDAKPKSKEVADDSQVLDSQPMRSDDEAASDPPSDAEQDSQVLDSQPMRSDDSASDPSSDAEPKSKKAKTEEP